jgi:secreted trypsin-like serine protease
VKLAQMITAWVGKFNLSETDEKGSEAHIVWQIIIHDDYDYKTESFDADLAIMVLEEKINFEKTNAGTICLPPASSSHVSGDGSIVRWSVSENPSELQLPTVPSDVCFADELRFAEISSNRTFCAGFKNQGKSACQGESGGGFFKFDGSTSRFSLVGIISTSLYNPFGSCRLDTYSVFTDVGKFVDWIEMKIEETREIKWQKVDFECHKIWR